ncbi:helix-turn-helix domain-containing protein [Embleya hyalina]|uniref:Transcriptional regulator n=1 Tax=Embleya hyalina TaxID=516124 RepID=A0A401YEK7_9ACTN|nr:helix-turn-helix domain-containing protein [Embleya hyalina]GCD93041.1 transcriptional regulator [Embleya hyalina]
MRDEDLPKHLGRLGLSDREALVYRAMLGTGPTGTANLAARLGMGPEEVDESVARLVELGLASAAGPAPAAVVPIEPSIGIERLAHVRSAELRQAQLAAIDAYRGYRRSVHPQQAGTDDMIEVLTGARIKERIRLSEHTATTEVLRFDSPPYHTGGVSNEVEERNLEHGVAYRIVYSKSAVQNAHYYECNIKPCIAAGEQARVLPTVPVKLTIFDRRLALVSMSFVEADINDSLLIVRASSLLTALIGLFESSWRAAFPLHLGGRVPPALRPIHRRILELLGSGLTDEAIAELLGISRRTLSRNLEHLNSSAGSTTRFQLALYAARKGWI